MAFLKSQETHLSVNSRLDAFMSEHGESSRIKGVQEGIQEERARIAALPVPLLERGPMGEPGPAGPEGPPGAPGPKGKMF
jgi:hypothetical protein